MRPGDWSINCCMPLQNKRSRKECNAQIQKINNKPVDGNTIMIQRLGHRRQRLGTRLQLLGTLAPASDNPVQAPASGAFGARFPPQVPRILGINVSCPQAHRNTPPPHPTPRTTSPRSNHVPRNTVFRARLRRASWNYSQETI